MEIEAEKAENLLKTPSHRTQESIQFFGDSFDKESQHSLASNAVDPDNDLLKIDFVDTNNQINIGQMVEPRPSATSSQYNQARLSLKSQMDDNVLIQLDNNDVILEEVEDDIINQTFRSQYTNSVLNTSVQEIDQQL